MWRAHCAAAAIGAAAAAGASTREFTAPEKWNVLYFVADDLRPEFLDAYDQKVMITPAVDRLAEEALVFELAYCSVPVCSPSRNSFMTGRRPHHTLIFDNLGTPTNDFRANGQGKDWVTMPEHFKNSGWLTLGGGKTFHPDHPAHWDQPRSWSQDRPYYDFNYTNGPCPGVGRFDPSYHGPGGCSNNDVWCAMDGPDSQFYDDGLATDTIDRLAYAKSTGKPWFIMSGFARPHAPWRVPTRFWELYDGVDMPLAKYRDVIDGMPGIAWHQQGFYDASNGTVFMPLLDRPLDDQVCPLLVEYTQRFVTAHRHCAPAKVEQRS